jgi:predicted nicotinamide N-methyase
LSPEDFIRANAAIAAPPLVPELRLHLATEVTPLWQATEAELERTQLPPPYWAFAWPGGQALARWILDHPADFVGKHVLDFAAAKVGASATAAEIDGFALAAIGLNADLNGVAVDIAARDVIGEASQWDAVLAGDMCYERPLAERLTAWLRELAASATILLGDPGRNYFPKAGLEQLARYTVPTSRDLEDRDARETGVWRVISS